MAVLLPIKMMLERVERNGGESDATRFWELTYAGELLLKLTCSALVAAVDESRDRDRYSLEHKLVRADGIGEWVQALEQTLTGPPSGHINPEAREIRNALSIRETEAGWRQRAVSLLEEVLQISYDSTLNVKERPSVRLWFNLFTQLRNKARGHGAPSPARLSACVSQLDESLTEVINNIPIAALDWVYLHQNLSGKYRVVPLSESSSRFAHLKTTAAHGQPNLANGVYIWLEGPRRVNLLYSDQDCRDFFFPNGDYKQSGFELHSLITDDRRRQSASAYQAPPTPQPESETEGSAELETIGNIFTNIPPKPSSYIQRPKIQQSIMDILLNDRHPILTLIGRGGIGKTSLALQVLHELAYQSRFDLIAWFSSRDIDLITSGAKQVRPVVLTAKDTAEFFRKLVGWPERDKLNQKIDAIDFMSRQLRTCDYGPTLFVFDNFETLRNPQDVYSWIDENIRLPNKALITSRFRDFRGDFPIEVSGMEPSEAIALIDETARRLGIIEKLESKDLELIREESEGHPYIIKILLGEIADQGSFSKPSALIARRDDVLNALFERTYSSLSPLATRIFLTLARWKSSVPQLVVEAALLRSSEEGIDPEAAIDQLVRVSLIERSVDYEGIDHLSVPLSAALFAREKLEVSANRPIIIEDVRFLQTLGATASRGDSRGLLPRLERLFADAARRIENSETSLSAIRPVLEFLARNYSKAWLLLARMERDISEDGWREKAAEYVRRYLQAQPVGDDAYRAWQELESLYREMDDAIAGCSAFLRAAEISRPPLERVSAMANWLNSRLRARADMDMDDRRAVFLPLARLMETYGAEADATDFSRLGWLYLNSGEIDEARRAAQAGVVRDESNIHCARLIDRLSS